MILFYTLLFIAQSFAEPVGGNSIPQQSILADGGKTNVNIELDNGENKMFFKLENPRNLDRKTLNLIKNQQIQAEIN